MSTLTSITAAVQASTAFPTGSHGEDTPSRPFVTLSRQAGAGAMSLLPHLVQRLTLTDPEGQPWEGYDRELVEKVAHDHDIHASLVERLEQESHSWLDDFLAGLAPSRMNQTEIAVERRVAETIRGLARRGRAVIVGRGGVFITRDMPEGVHVHLVAPLRDRIDRLARQRDLTRAEAEAEIDRIDTNRTAFYKRHFPLQPFGPELFTLTLNTSAFNDEGMADQILAALQSNRARMQHAHGVRHAA